MTGPVPPPLRFSKSSYDYLFAKPELRWLLGDYMATQGINAALYFAPPADDRFTVKARLGTAVKESMTLRFQPLGSQQPHTFIEVKATPRVATGTFAFT